MDRTTARETLRNAAATGLYLTDDEADKLAGDDVDDETLCDMIRLHAMLRRLFVEHDQINTWLRSPVPAMGDQTPIAYLMEHGPRPIIDLLASHSYL